MEPAFISAPPLRRITPTASSNGSAKSSRQPPASGDNSSADFDSIVNWVLKGPSSSANASSSSRDRPKKRVPPRRYVPSAPRISEPVTDIFDFSDAQNDDAQSGRNDSRGARQRGDYLSRSRGRGKRRGRLDSRNRSARYESSGSGQVFDGSDGMESKAEDVGVNVDSDLDIVVDPADAFNGDEGESDVDLTQVDDTVDDGFFSRYRKEAESGKQVVDNSSLDADEPDKDNYLEVDAQQEASRRPPGGHRKAPFKKKMDREKAASAFDAMDRLFGSLNSGNQQATSDGNATSRPGVSQNPGGRHVPTRSDAKQRRDASMNRAAWLADVRARAATKGDRSRRGGRDDFDDDDHLTLDVHAVEESASNSVRSETSFNNREVAAAPSDQVDVQSDPEEDEFSEAAIGGNTAENNVTERMSGLKDQERTQLSNAEDASGNYDGTSRAARDMRESASERGRPKDAGSPFQNLMQIAKQGPGNASTSGDNESPKRSQSARRQAKLSADDESSGYQRESSGSSTRGRRKIDAKRTSRRRSDVPSLLDLTQRIISGDQDISDKEDINELSDGDEDVGTSVELRGSKASRRRSEFPHAQKYSAVRRIGGRSRRVLSEPDEWRPLDNREVGKVRSDNGPLGGRGRGSHLNKVVAECKDCRGSGLDTCSACAGSGWIGPISMTSEKKSQSGILEEIWSRPNLVIDCNGEAQCVMCNGIGKQFCTTCEGSGSALRKGFSLSEKNEAFGMFPGVDRDSFPDEDDEYSDVEDEEDDDDEDEDDFEYVQLYRGPESTFTAGNKTSTFQERVDVVDTEGAEDVMEVEDESAELLATLEAMHLADLEESGPDNVEQIRRRSIVLDRSTGDEDEEDEDDDADDEDEDDGDFSIDEMEAQIEADLELDDDNVGKAVRLRIIDEDDEDEDEDEDEDDEDDDDDDRDDIVVDEDDDDEFSIDALQGDIDTDRNEDTLDDEAPHDIVKDSLQVLDEVDEDGREMTDDDVDVELVEAPFESERHSNAQNLGEVASNLHLDDEDEPHESADE